MATYLLRCSPCCYTCYGYTILTTPTKVLSLLLVTHDRSFLERTCGEILELDNAAVYSYQVHLLHLLYPLRLCLLCCRLLLPGTYSHSSFSLELDNVAVYSYQVSVARASIASSWITPPSTSARNTYYDHTYYDYTYYHHSHYAAVYSLPDRGFVRDFPAPPRRASRRGRRRPRPAAG